MWINGLLLELSACRETDQCDRDTDRQTDVVNGQLVRMTQRRSLPWSPIC